MLQKNGVLERELAFTRIYRENLQADKAQREAACLAYQIPHLFVGMRRPDTEVLVGRIDKPQIGFYAILNGSLGLDHMCYCVNEDWCRKQMEEALAAGSCSQERKAQIEEMLDFWRTEDTMAKGQAMLTEAQKRGLTGVNYNEESGMVYPLYRMAGLNLDVKKLCRYGLSGLQELIRERKKQAGADSVAFLDGCISVLETMKEVCRMYAKEVEGMEAACSGEGRRAELARMRTDLLFLTEQAPETLHQAVQLTTLYMLASDTREIGRLDDHFGSFYVRDLEEGRICREDAVRLVANFFEIIEEEFHRDTRALIGGRGREREADADEFALVVLDVLEKRPDCWQPQVSLRRYEGMDERVYDQALSILAQGRTFPLLYNDDVNVASTMRAMDVKRADAEQYSFFGCGEYMLAGRSMGTPNALINLAKVLEVTLHNGVDPTNGKCCGLNNLTVTETTEFEELMADYEEQVAYCADLAGDFQQLTYDISNQECSYLLSSILTQDCIERGRAMFDGGIHHLGGTCESYGNITTSDSLAAIREVVYEKKLVTLPELVRALDANFEGYETLRQALLAAPKFGNDDDRADDLAVRVHENVCGQIRRQRERTRMDSYLVVVINNNMNVAMGDKVGATADGRKARAFLSNANGAYNNCDKQGLTALMRSMTKLDTSIHAGANQNFKFSPSMFDQDYRTVKGVLGAFFKLGGQQTNLSVVNQADLENAMIHPENHENLQVRVGGYTAHFVTLDKKTQREVLTRTAY